MDNLIWALYLVAIGAVTIVTILLPSFVLMATLAKVFQVMP